MAPKHLSGWDLNSGIRERLALLANIGPTLRPTDWLYHPSYDAWQGLSGRAHVAVTMEGSASLERLLTRWGIPRADAMLMVGYPEGR